MPSLRARPREAEMEPSVPGLSPRSPAGQACVTGAPTLTRSASALRGPLYSSDTERGTTPPHQQQPGTGSLASPPGVVCAIKGRVPRGLEGPRLKVKEEINLAPDCPLALGSTLWFPCLT